MRKLLFAIMVYVFSRVERMRVRFRALARLLRGRQRALVCLLFLAAGPSLYAQKYVTVCGFLEDRATGGFPGGPRHRRASGECHPL